jgi:hypothetical protein
MSHRRAVARAPRFAITLLCLVVHAACTSVDGGAVELSWRLRPNSGAGISQPFVECDNPMLSGTGAVTGILLEWLVGEDHSSVVFDCNAGHGVTRFVLPPGQALLSVSPVCMLGPAAATTYTAPAPKQSTVTVGNTVSLGAVELILQVTDCGLGSGSASPPCICQCDGAQPCPGP